jgi:hypothetical protein
VRGSAVNPQGAAALGQDAQLIEVEGTHFSIADPSSTLKAVEELANEETSDDATLDRLDQADRSTC